MTDRDFKFNVGRWFLWGLIAILALTAGIMAFAVLTDSSDDEDDGGAAVEQVEWSIEVSEYAPAPGTITLKGDLPFGFPTETWKDDRQLARTVSAEPWEWKMDVSPEVPLPVYEIDLADTCDEVIDLLREWAEATSSAAGEARQAEAQAFAQYALDKAVDQGCEIPGI